MKFKKGDIVIRNNNNPNHSIGEIKKDQPYTIEKIMTIDNTNYYTLKHYSNNGIGVLFPIITFDALFDLEKIYMRSKKLKKIYERIGTS